MGGSKFSADIVGAIRAQRAAGESLHSLARIYGAARSTIKRITSHATWKHVA